MTLMESGQVKPPGPFSKYLILTLTHRCPGRCVTCFNNSGPDGDHGVMTGDDWCAVLDQAAETGDVGLIQLFGGEPLLYPEFDRVLDHALNLGFEVEVYTALFFMTPARWEKFTHPRVRLATTYHSVHPEVNDSITRLANSHGKIRRHIARAVELGILMRVAVIEVDPEAQDIPATRADLISLGVPAELINVDRMRIIGRAIETTGRTPNDPVTELCGNCGIGRAEVGPDGVVQACGMSSAFPLGNVLETPILDIVAGSAMAGVRAMFAGLDFAGMCTPAIPGVEGAPASPEVLTSAPRRDCVPCNSPPPPPSPGIWEGTACTKTPTLVSVEPSNPPADRCH